MKARELSDADLLTLCGLFARGWMLEYGPVTACWWLIRPVSFWSTSLYRSPSLAIAAAAKLHAGADVTIAKKAQLRENLRAAFEETAL